MKFESARLIFAVFNFINSFAAKYRFQLHLFFLSFRCTQALFTLFIWLHFTFALRIERCDRFIVTVIFRVSTSSEPFFNVLFVDSLFIRSQQMFYFSFSLPSFLSLWIGFSVALRVCSEILTQSIALFSHWALFMDIFLFESKLSLLISVSFFRMPMIRWQLTIQTQPQYLQPRARASSLLLV